ncbi:MAG: hypothetical protein CL912_16755 [Deltaproteobacteria bacterium]|nr:hypothetical protein [Deltaproteobacteria bacterium]
MFARRKNYLLPSNQLWEQSLLWDVCKLIVSSYEKSPKIKDGAKVPKCNQKSVKERDVGLFSTFDFPRSIIYRRA